MNVAHDGCWMLDDGLRVKISLTLLRLALEVDLGIEEVFLVNWKLETGNLKQYQTQLIINNGNGRCVID